MRLVSALRSGSTRLRDGNQPNDRGVAAHGEKTSNKKAMMGLTALCRSLALAEKEKWKRIFKAEQQNKG